MDGGPDATAGLDEAIRMARLTGGKLRLFHVLDAAAYATGFEPAAVYWSDVLPRMKLAGARILQEGKSRAREAGVAAQSVLFESIGDRVADLALEQAASWQADLIVIGTHGRHGVDRFFMAAMPSASCAARTCPSCWSGARSKRPRRRGPRQQKPTTHPPSRSDRVVDEVRQRNRAQRPRIAS